MDNQETRVVLQSGWFKTLKIAQYVIKCNVFVCTVLQYANELPERIRYFQRLNKLKQVASCLLFVHAGDTCKFALSNAFQQIPFG